MVDSSLVLIIMGEIELKDLFIFCTAAGVEVGNEIK